MQTVDAPPNTPLQQTATTVFSGSKRKWPPQLSDHVDVVGFGTPGQQVAGQPFFHQAVNRRVADQRVRCQVLELILGKGTHAKDQFGDLGAKPLKHNDQQIPDRAGNPA